MIKTIEVYLITDGNGQEAVKFYQDALGAELVSMSLWGDMIPNCPVEQSHLVMNAQLSINGIRMMISDESPAYTYQSGTNMSAALITDDVKTAQHLFDKLSVDARKIYMPLQPTFWSPAYSGLIDKFGMNWQINTEVEGYVPENLPEF